MRRRLSGWVLFYAVVIGAACTLAPSNAGAQQTDPVAFWGATIGVGVPMLTVDVILVAEAIDKLIHEGYGLHAPGAIFEIVWGAVHIAGAVVAGCVSTLAYDPMPLALTFGMPLTLMGAYFLGHGIWSLIPRGPARSETYVSLATSDRGMQVLLFGTF